MAYTQFNLIVDLLGKLGQLDVFLATSGSTSTVINTKIAERASQPEENYAIDYYAFVLTDAAGASAAPEGELRRIQSYDSGTNVFTVDTVFSAAVAANDEIALAKKVFPVRQVMNLIRTTLRRLGITLPDVTLTTVDGQQVYSLPVTAKMERPAMVEIQTVAGDVDTYVKRYDYEYIPASPGTAGGLRFVEDIGSAGMTIRLYYNTNGHPALASVSSVISEVIPQHLVTQECLVDLIAWYNNQSGGNDGYWKQRENMERDTLDAMKQRGAKITKTARTPKYFTPPV